MRTPTPKNSSRTKGWLAGNFCCFSPEPPGALFITDATGARTSEKGEVTMRGLFATAVFCLAVSAAQGQAPPAAQNEKPKDSQVDCPMHPAHGHDDSSSSAMNDRGEKGMGFSQTTTTHHFLLSADGGVIQVEAEVRAPAYEGRKVSVVRRPTFPAIGAEPVHKPARGSLAASRALVSR